MIFCQCYEHARREKIEEFQVLQQGVENRLPTKRGCKTILEGKCCAAPRQFKTH